MQMAALIETVIEEVRQVEGVKAIVLGGSRARGTHTESSDVDVGIYYHPDTPLELPALSKVATYLDDEHRTDVITEIGGWGPWINGGGWLKIESYPVDFLYRDLERVGRIIDDCLQEKVEIVYQPGHPFGFVSAIYLAELAVCQPLWDPGDVITGLKKKIVPYPDALRKALIEKFYWEINFSIEIARKSVVRQDVTYVAGSCFRSVMCMLQVLFALNKEYWLNEKGAVALADTFARKPERLEARINETMQLLDANPQSIQRAILNLEGLSNDVSALLKENEGQSR